MRDHLTQTVYKFIKQHLDPLLDPLLPSSSILLGLSGGPDSIALLYILKKCQEILKFQLGVAHVDHGWRAESSIEALELESLVKRLDLEPYVGSQSCSHSRSESHSQSHSHSCSNPQSHSQPHPHYHLHSHSQSRPHSTSPTNFRTKYPTKFHTISLNPAQLTGNLEEACRLKRQEFFRHLCAEHNYQAVILGHHRDDQAETVLKRLFEGAPLTSCGGIRPVKKLEGLTIWRPLLTVGKQEILDWLNHQNIQYFIDQTNSDPKFLRSRMRNELIPLLERHFGKGISQNLAWIGEEAHLLQETMEAHVRSIWDSRNNPAPTTPTPTPSIPTPTPAPTPTPTRSTLNTPPAPTTPPTILAPTTKSQTMTISSISLDSEVCTDYEIIWLIRSMCREHNCFPSREILTTILDDIKQGELYKRYRLGSIEILLSKLKNTKSNFAISLNRKTLYDII